MLLQFQNKLLSTVRRKRLINTVQGLVLGCLAGSILCLALFGMKWLGYPVTISLIGLSWAGAALVGAVIAMAWPIALVHVAQQVDACYLLKDRVESALLFASRPAPSSIEQMQMQDAYARMDQIKPGEVYPWRRPRYSGAAMACVALLFGCMFVPFPLASTAQGTVDDFVVVKQQADVLEESMLKELEELTKEYPEPKLQELYEKLKEDVETLQEPETNQETALLKLSEMQQEIAAALEEFNLEKMDADLRELGQALQAGKSLEAAASAMQQGDHEKAASELEKWDASNLSRKERAAVAANLSKMLDSGQSVSGELSEAAAALKEGIENSDNQKCEVGKRKACEACKSQALKKKLSTCLSCQLNRLGECKCQCQGNCNKSGGQGVKKSDNPSNSAGKGVSDGALGDTATSLQANRQQENLQGTSGDGPVEREITESPEGEQEATRNYQKRYAEFQRQMEEVLQSEPLPLGHRDTVRRYFESIRPSNTESEKQ